MLAFTAFAFMLFNPELSAAYNSNNQYVDYGAPDAQNASSDTQYPPVWHRGVSSGMYDRQIFRILVKSSYTVRK